MILLATLLAQADAQESTAQELAFCSKQDGQPYRFCLADRKHERAERDLAAALATARRAAIAQKREIEDYTRANGGVTLAGDPAKALDAAQRAWTQSYRADCVAIGLATATGNAGTEGVTENWDCEADRMFERVRFLNAVYPIRR